MQLHIIKAESDEDFNKVFEIREAVFGEELSVGADDEYDGMDHISNHYLAILDGIVVGTARWRLGPLVHEIRMERFAVLPTYRNQGIGTALFHAMRKGISDKIPIVVYANEGSVSFYETLGFIKDGEPFDEAGLPHQSMRLG